MKKYLKFFLIILIFCLPLFVFADDDDDDDDPYYDLGLDSISIEPQHPTVGEDVIITVKIKNNGNTNLYNSLGLSSYYVDLGDFLKDDTTIPFPTVEDYIAPNGYIYFIYNGYFQESGTKNIDFIVDNDDKMSESDEGNNSISVSTEVYRLDEADIKVSSIEYSIDKPLVHESLDITISIENSGKTSLVDNTGFELDSTGFGEDDVIIEIQNFKITTIDIADSPTFESPLEPDGNYEYIYSGYFFKTGENNIDVELDYQDRLEESEEFDNASSSSAVVYSDADDRDGFIIFEPKLNYISSSSVMIEWDTDLESDGKVDCKKSIKGKDVYYVDEVKRKNHQVIIDDLVPVINYYYRTISNIGDVIKYSKSILFSVPNDNEVKLIDDVVVTSSSDLLRFTWETNLLSNSYIYYKKTDEENYSKIGSDDMADYHEVSISGLSNGIYDYFVSSTSTPGTAFVSEAENFTISSDVEIVDEQEDESDEEVGEEDSVENEEVSDDVSTENVLVISNQSMYDSLKGKIMLKVESNGEAYYIHPSTQEMYYLGRPDDAFSVMREQGVGITSSNLEKIQIGLGSLTGQDSDSDGLSDLFEDGIGTDKNMVDTDGDGNDDMTELENNYNPNGNDTLSFDSSFADAQIGNIFLDVERNGEAWYINPSDSMRYFLGRPADAFQVMRNLGLGISNDNFDSL